MAYLSQGLGEFDVNSEEWEKSTHVANSVIRMLASEIAREAAPYKLTIDKLVRQGSAREGLKVCFADEFDVLLQFSIKDLQFEVQPEHDQMGRSLPEIGKLRVRCPANSLQVNYPKLYAAEAFVIQDGHVYLNSRILHERIFTAIIDKSRESVRRIINSSDDYSFRLLRAINQPAVKITIKYITTKTGGDVRDHLGDHLRRFSDQHWMVLESAGGIAIHEKTIDVDLVPALLISHDQVPDPVDDGRFMECPRYAVFKWVRDNHPFTGFPGVNPEAVWRLDSSGYEKHVLDVALGAPEQRYILTAQRVMKAYFLNENRNRAPPQIVTVLRSYFLKQIAFYCILYYTILQKMPLSGVREALSILLDFLEICLEVRRLPHFFHTNPWLCYMFPDYDMGTNALRYDVFHTISPDALHQARLDIQRCVRPALGHFTCELGPVAKGIKDKFREFVTKGDYP